MSCHASHAIMLHAQSRAKCEHGSHRQSDSPSSPSSWALKAGRLPCVEAKRQVSQSRGTGICRHAKTYVCV